MYIMMSKLELSLPMAVFTTMHIYCIFIPISKLFE